MHLFILSSQVVYPPTDGGKQGIYYRMNALGGRVRVSVCMVNSADIVVEDGGFDDVYHSSIIPQILKPSIECGRVELMHQTIHWFIRGLPRQALVTDSVRERERLMAYIRETQVTTVLLESPFVAPLLDLPQLREWNVKIVVVLHNIEHLYFQETTTWPTLLRSMEYERIKKYELEILRQADLGISISPWDAQYFKEQLGASNVVYLPSVLPCEDARWHSQDVYRRAVLSPKLRRRHMVFGGGFLAVQRTVSQDGTLDYREAVGCGRKTRADLWTCPPDGAPNGA